MNRNETNNNIPAGLNCWTADEVAECLSGIGPAIYSKLWDILIAAKTPTPLGGDGSNGTVEEPHERYDDDHDDKSSHWWWKLTPAEQATIRDSYLAQQ